MPAASFTKSYEDDVDLTEAQLDDLKNSIEDFLNVTKLDQDNIQDGGITTDTLATNSVTTAKIASSAVTTAKIEDGAVIAAKIADGSVTTAKIVDLNVTTGKIADLAVTAAKLSPVSHTKFIYSGAGTTATQDGLAVSDDASLASTGSTTYVSLPDTEVTITSGGRPVLLVIQPTASSDNSKEFTTDDISAGTESLAATGHIAIFRDGSYLTNWTYAVRVDLDSVDEDVVLTLIRLRVPCSLTYIDAPAAGTYTYDVRGKAGTSGDVVEVNNIKLIAVEL